VAIYPLSRRAILPATAVLSTLKKGCRRKSQVVPAGGLKSADDRPGQKAGQQSQTGHRDGEYQQ
jgi:hypothetical protein